MGASNTKSYDLGGSEDVCEAVVCKESDVKENEMKAFEVGDVGKVLIAKQGGKFFAVGNKCSHYGAPLNTGVLGPGHVRCPWHGACFSLATGDIEEFPGLDGIPCFKVEVQKNGDVKVKARRKDLGVAKVVKPMVSRDKNNNTTFVIVGGGPAALSCAETLRQEGFTGRLVMVAKEDALPYDRIKLSKGLDTTAEKLQLRPPEFYKEHDIEVMLNTEVQSVNHYTKMVKLSSGTELKYNSVFLATGSTPRRLECEGSNLKNIFVLRDVSDANKIQEQLNPERDVVIAGASFIGMECAAYCQGKVKSVTVVGRGSVPFKAVLGEEIGARIKAVFEEKGVQFRLGADLVKLLPSSNDSNSVGKVVLTDGSELPADVVIAGIGAIPNTHFLNKADYNLEPNGSVPVDKHLETNVKGVYAGGDIANAPVLHTKASIGHWQLAQYHGHIAGRNMAGKSTNLKAVPFFWTMFLGKSIRYAGFAPSFDKIIINGSLADLEFVAYYCQGDSVNAIATMKTDPVAAKFADLLQSGRRLTRSEVEKNPNCWCT
ncbi:apoptosis-inducing factor 3 isoform X2 [Anabrus simplex]